MDPAYVNELEKDNNGVKYLLVRQDLFCQNRRCKGNEDKRSEGNSQDIFKKDYQNDYTKENLSRTGDRICWSVPESFLTLKELKFTLQWVKRKQHLQNVQYAHSKTFYIATCRIIGTNIFIKYLNFLQ